MGAGDVDEIALDTSKAVLEVDQVNITSIVPAQRHP